jgi:RNA methyltransferase, TrmH family
MQHITSRKNPLVARAREIARGDADGLVLLDGAHLVEDALAAGMPIREVVVASQALDRADIARLVNALARRGVETASASAAVMDALSPVRSASAIVAIAERPADAPERVYGGDAPLVLIAAGVQDPGNLGAMVRVAEAGGATGFVATGQSADPFSWKALRGSMGSALRMPVASHRDVEEALDEARRHQCRIVATVPRGGQSHYDVDFCGPVAVLIGGEGGGLAQEIVAGADARVTIPMAAPVESLNAAVAAAILVYEARRQRHKNSEF